LEDRDKIRVIAVVGPTASGKTALGVALAKHVGGEVVSCDSMQVYRGMDIASAKPTLDEMDGVPHHLIGFLSDDESYSVARFVKDARSAINDICSRGKIPVLVGGTGLYVNSLLDNINFSGEGSDPRIRGRLESEAAESGNEAMLEKLRSVDPEYAAKLHPNNLKRIIRALELYETVGITMSEQLARSKSALSEYEPVMIGIRFADRALLYDRINRRVDRMMESGLLEEARDAFERANGGTAFQAIGHKEFAPYFRGEISRDEAVESLKRETRRYAKRQMTWFLRDERINWIFADGKNQKNIEENAIKILEDNGFCDTIK
jgi:tRNA dimethylallyltransferase